MVTLLFCSMNQQLHFFHVCSHMVFILLMFPNPGATQNSIRVAQVSFSLLHTPNNTPSSILVDPLLRWVELLCMFCQWMLQIPDATSYIGCIGKDFFGEEMKKNSKLAGVNVSLFMMFKSFSLYKFDILSLADRRSQTHSFCCYAGTLL